MLVVGLVRRAKHTENPNSENHDLQTHVHPNPFHQTQSAKCDKHQVYLVDEEYLVTALVPSETACFASSPGRMSRTLIY